MQDRKERPSVLSPRHRSSLAMALLVLGLPLTLVWLAALVWLLVSLLGLLFG